MALAGVPSLIGIWLLLSPGRLMSRAMTWDFLFILSGAWHLKFGQVPHVDFHEPLAALNFLLPLAAFSLFGTSPFAFLGSVAMLAAVVFVLACLASWRRLPLVPASVFVLFAVFLVLMPTTVGDHISVASFAMSYNRYGWAALSILTLILFVPPRSDGRDWVDIVASAVLIVGMFYLKVTYFVAGLAGVALALLVCAHVRLLWKVWMATGVLIVANALAPYSHPYLADLWNATMAGGIRPPKVALWTFIPGAMQHAPYAAAFVVAALLWMRGECTLRLPAAMAFIMVIGVVLLSQNAEPDGVPLGIVMAFLIYDHLRSRPMHGRADGRLLLMVTVTVFPLFAVCASLASLVLYTANARGDRGLSIIDRTQLRGLAVPTEPSGLLEAFSRNTENPHLLNRTRQVSGNLELTAAEYVQTLLEAADLLSDKRYPPGGVVLLDQVNPLPFMLGIKPPRGNNLWSSLNRPILPAQALFADASYVLVPKFSTALAWTDRAYAEYAGYLAIHFPHRVETKSWILFSRREPAVDQGR